MLIRSSGFVPAICNYLLENVEHCGGEPEQAANARHGARFVTESSPERNTSITYRKLWLLGAPCY